MNNQEGLERLNRQIAFYYQILKASWTETTVLHNLKQKEKERQQRYHDAVDQFLGFKN
ncbi:MAG: hypothetical protein ACFFDC_05335 [Promethearchaeota archaeon]